MLCLDKDNWEVNLHSHSSSVQAWDKSVDHLEVLYMPEYWNPSLWMQKGSYIKVKENLKEGGWESLTNINKKTENSTLKYWQLGVFIVGLWGI